MNARILCPGCGSMLQVPADESRSFTCPHCLAEVPRPALAEAIATAPTAPPAEAVQDRPGPTPDGETICRGCGSAIEGEWRFCPACGAYRSGRPLAQDEDYPDPQVRRDHRGTSWSLGCLTILGGIGLLYALAAGGSVGGEGMAIVLLILLLVVAGSAAWTYSRPNAPKGAAGVGRVALGTLQVLGMIFTGLFLLMIAFWGFFFVACLATGGRLFH
jgi:hypothetical protein